MIDDSPIGPFLVMHLIMDVRDAMGANAINTALRSSARWWSAQRRARAAAHPFQPGGPPPGQSRLRDPDRSTGTDKFSGEEVRDRIIAAWAFAAADPYRAATHNKGIMNGVDAVLLATGNDWRAVEAGAHAYAARTGKYTSLSRWSKGKNGDLTG